MTLRREELVRFWWEEVDGHRHGETDIPTNIHLDLINAQEINDPFYGMIERDVQWVHDRDWRYGCHFQKPDSKPGEKIDLVLEGLDTFATVTLNGKQLLTSDNMFVSHRVDVTELLRDGENDLSILFESAYVKSEQLRKEKGELLCWNGHYGRVHVRKAQYHYGWDWGPSLITCGPWKPIYLDTYSGRIEDVDIRTTLNEALDHADVKVTTTVSPGNFRIVVTITTPGNTHMRGTADASGHIEFDIPCPSLWYPNELGKQDLYDLKVELMTDDVRLDLCEKRFGIRKFELVREKDSIGETFYFRVNNIPVFMGGTNWIPWDSFLPRMNKRLYRSFIDLAKTANHNMIRVWGGGIYEDDEFYDACDNAGLLVWQDFCFACGQYPAYPEFVESVKQEAVDAVKRLRHHASLAIFAGNNEDYQIANEGLKHDMSMPADQWLDSTFPARHIYENVLPEVVKTHAPDTIYWPGSPYGGIDNNSDRWFGDVHIWNVSSGMLVPYQRYPDLTARFVSEFGMLSCPHYETVREYFFGQIDDHDLQSGDYHPQSEAFEFHCKASSYEKRMFTCMGEQFRMSFELKTYIYLTQLLQSEAMSFAFRGWRREFAKRRCGGALVWQLNDCWPATSWALIDYDVHPKAAYYTIARAMKPIAIGVMRKPSTNPRPNLQHEALCNGRTKADAANVIAHATPHLYPSKTSTYAVWVCNSTFERSRVTVELRYISVATGKMVKPTTKHEVTLDPTDTTELFAGETPETEPTVLAARIYNDEGVVIGYDCDWPQPLKHLTFPDRGLNVQMTGRKLTLTADRPVKAVMFQDAGLGYSDNCIDVMPGDEHIVILDQDSPSLPEYLYYGMP